MVILSSRVKRKSRLISKRDEPDGGGWRGGGKIYSRVFGFSSLTTASCPLSAANDSGVRPYLSLESGSTPSSTSSSLTTAQYPFATARDSGVCPCPSLESGSTPSSTSSSLTTTSCPFSAARDSGV